MDKVIRKVEDIIDSFLDEYDSDHTIIRNENEQISEFYKFTNEAVANWKKSKQCIVQECQNSSIKRSHTIQKSNSLKLISEEGKVFTPDSSIDGHLMREIGINNASTFPGFCQHHEKIFEKFENSKTFENIQDYALQLYRSICREEFRLKYELSYFSKMIENQKKTRNEHLISRIKKEIGVDINFESLKITNDHSISVLEHWKNEKDILYKKVHDFYNDYSKEIFSDSSSNDFSILKLEIDTNLPVCLSSTLTFSTEKNEAVDDILTFVNILPFKEKTLILFCCRSFQYESVKTYLSRFNDSTSLLNMVEAWMVLQTDHWFLKPTIWNKKNEKQKEIILEKIQNYDESALETDVSIFDDIRNILISSAMSQKETSGRESFYNDIIKKESRKLGKPLNC